MTKTRNLMTLAVILCAMTLRIAAHCEVPCGIYDDQMRAKMIAEHATTIEKAMTQIGELGSQTPVNYNQLVRWVTNKEHHATEVQHIISQYFLTQRIKPDAENYGKKLEGLHKMLLAAMKCKQNADPATADTEKLYRTAKGLHQFFTRYLVQFFTYKRNGIQ